MFHGDDGKEVVCGVALTLITPSLNPPMGKPIRSTDLAKFERVQISARLNGEL